jgi:hypothetical protein
MLCVLHCLNSWSSADASRRENDITDVLEETFSVTEDRFGEHVVVELRPGGATQDVTEIEQRRSTSISSSRTGSRGASRSSSARSWRGSATCCR